MGGWGRCQLQEQSWHGYGAVPKRGANFGKVCRIRPLPAISCSPEKFQRLVALKRLRARGRIGTGFRIEPKGAVVAPFEDAEQCFARERPGLEPEQVEFNGLFGAIVAILYANGVQLAAKAREPKRLSLLLKFYALPLSGRPRPFERSASRRVASGVQKKYLSGNDRSKDQLLYVVHVHAVFVLSRQ